MSQSSEYWQDRCNELECDVADLRENLETLQDENKRLLVTLRSTCETDTEIETLCAEVLGMDFVAGDTFGVPGPLACVHEVVQRLKKAQLDLADMTRLAMEYKDANTRLESQLRELLAPRDEAYGRLRAAIGI